MIQPSDGPIIRITDLPEFSEPIALHGARLNDGPVLEINDDLWIIAVILVYESAA